MASRKRPRGRPFPKGQSGNPGGRPSKKEFKDFLGEVVDARAGSTRRDAYRLALYLKAIDRRDKDQLRALELIAAYDMGKPIQGVELTGPWGGPVQTENLTSEQQVKRILDLVTEARAGRAADAEPLGADEPGRSDAG